jgi:hypothetical protein
MDLGLKQRLDKIRQLKDEFGLDQQRIADFCEPPRNRTTVAKVLGGTDERYFTESNLEAIEKGIDRLLDEYRKKLCR